MAVYFNQVPEQWPPILGVDTETTGLDPHVEKLLSIALSDGNDVWIFLHIHGFSKVLPVLQDPNVLKIFHFAKFDMKFIKKFLGVEVQNIFCTMLAEQIHLGGRTDPASLAEVAARRVGIFMSKETQQEFIGHPGFHVQPITAKQTNYMAEDVLWLPAIRESQLQDLAAASMSNLPQMEFDCVPAFADIELKGFVLDVPLWFEQVKWFNEQIEQCVKDMTGLIGLFIIQVPGMNKKQPIIKEIGTLSINFNSSDQLKAVLQQRFNLKAPDTRDETLQAIISGEISSTQDGKKFVQTLVKYRGYRKRIGFDYADYVNMATGKVHPSIHQLGAGTGRVSISDPGLHQVPRPVPGEPNMRHLWRADSDNYVLARVDYNQQEPRILADLSHDPAMILACNQEDVYIEFAKHLYGYPVDKQSEERQITKAFVLAVGYGAGAMRLHRASGRPYDDCERIRAKIQAQFPTMVAYANSMERFEQKYGYVLTAAGRRRYFTKKQGGFRFSQAVNTTVQGTAADMFKLAVGKLQKTLTNMIKDGKIDPNTRIWHVVHDEIVVQCHKDQSDIVVPIVKEIMEWAGNELCPSVKHIAEAKVAPTWDK